MYILTREKSRNSGIVISCTCSPEAGWTAVDSFPESMPICNLLDIPGASFQEILEVVVQSIIFSSDGEGVTPSYGLSTGMPRLPSSCSLMMAGNAASTISSLSTSSMPSPRKSHGTAFCRIPPGV